jgi:hypothetical protein
MLKTPFIEVAPKKAVLKRRLYWRQGRAGEPAAVDEGSPAS